MCPSSPGSPLTTTDSQHYYKTDLHTVNPQNYMGVNFHKSAQYSNSTSKTFMVWWLKGKSAMPLINLHM